MNLAKSDDILTDIQHEGVQNGLNLQGHKTKTSQNNGICIDCHAGSKLSPPASQRFYLHESNQKLSAAADETVVK